MESLIFPIGVVAIVVLLTSIRQINQYERGIKLRFGRFVGIMNPGWRILLPVIEKMYKVDIRVQAVDVPAQESLTRDNIPVGVNAVVYFKVVDAEKALLNVQHFNFATSQLAQTTIRNAVGEETLATLLSDRDRIGDKIRNDVDKVTLDWGIEIMNLELKDIVISEELKRTIAKVAEAERERQAVIIQAEGEVAAAENLAKAAKILGSEPGALHIRTLAAINDISSDNSNTTIWMIPLEVLRAVEGLTKNKQ